MRCSELGTIRRLTNETMTTELKRRFDDDGLIASVAVMSPSKARHYAQLCDDFRRRYQDHPEYSRWTYGKTELLLTWVVELAREPGLLDIVEQLLGPDILLWNAFLPLKPPQSAAHFGWHQDATYWPVEPAEEIVSVWVALSAVTMEHGAMRMVRGSHLTGTRRHEKTFDENSMLRRGQRAEVNDDDENIVDISLEPGQASVHHTLTLHGSGPNRSNDWRLGVGLNYASAKVRPCEGHEDCALLLKGSGRNAGLDLATPPAEDMSPAAMACYEEANQRQSRRYSDT